MREPLIIGHRGASAVALENTIAAFEAAIAAGADGIEFDVRLSRDGVPVIIHDDTLSRTHGVRRRVVDLTAEELRSVGVPSLRELFELMTGNSHQTVPAFFAEHPGKQFDLILVDGDHSAEGAREDLLSVLPRVAPGGAIVFDDIVHPMHHYLEDVWCEVMQDRGFLSATYTSTGYGVAIALSGSEPFSTP